MKTSVFVVSILLISWGISAAGPALNGSSAPATFIQMNGVPNFHRVSDNLFRSAQPTSEGIQNLNTLGIKTIINLCSGNDPEVGSLGLVYEHLPMQVWNPKEKQVTKFLQTLIDNKNTPVLVHCQHGADRTGTLCALYRIAVQGWTKEQALKEMIDGGFGFHQIWTYLITHWVNGLDIEKIRREAGIKEGAGPAGASIGDVHHVMIDTRHAPLP